MVWWLLACRDPGDPPPGTTPPTGTTPPPTGTTPPPTGTTPPPTGTTPPTVACPEGSGPQLESTIGCLVGAVAPSGREQFLGVPYAEPPVGALRFASTVPKAPMADPFEATAYGSSCLQFSESFFQPTKVGDGSEDCLTLNVFRPPGARDLPLLVFVHGGGYLTGSNASDYLQDPALAEQAVVVTVNYRLGAMGFLAHPALSAEDLDGVSGNYGLQDLLVALTWVRDNAEALGGDPDRTLLFGESAGGLQTCSARASPRAGGLCDAAIIQSAPCGSLAKPLRDPPLLVVGGEEQGEEFVTALGCEADTAACLRALPAEVIVEVGQSDVLSTAATWNWQPWIDGVWMPAVPVSEAFVAGDWNQVPVTATANADEGTLFTFGLAPTQDVLDTLITTYAFALGVDAEVLSAEYTAARYGSTDLAYAALFGDAVFLCPTVWQQEVLAAQVPARGGHWVYAGEDLLGLGAFHGSEMPYVMGTMLELADPEQVAMSDRLRGAWRSTVEPEPAVDGLGPWPTVDAGWVVHDLAASTVAEAPRAAQCAVLEDSRANPYR
ncbi:MAG: carboxylesterase family protein [Myxococcota bacterium]